MIILDKILQQCEQRGEPIRVALVGAGFMASGIALQINAYTRGMRLVAVVNRDVDKAHQACLKAGIEPGGMQRAESPHAFELAVSQGRVALTSDPALACSSGQVDVVVEVTGAVEYGAHVAMAAISHRKHMVAMNAELDGTIGPILKVYADRHGVVFTNADGDQPGVIMNLYRFVQGIGLTPVLCGNIKGLHDPYRTPTTQKAFAERWKQNTQMVTSFADGTKISFEQAIVANATGMRVGQRGMFGPTRQGAPISDAPSWYPASAMREGPGIVDYVVGALPSPGVFVIATCDDPQQKHYLNLYKLGEGPFYVFHTPYHLCHFEVPNTIARAALLRDATIAPLAGPVVDVVAAAKIDLVPGDLIDGIGGYTTYGLAENHDVVRRSALLPMGLAGGCRLRHHVKRDQVLTYADVDVPADRLCDRLRSEQDIYFSQGEPELSRSAAAAQ